MASVAGNSHLPVTAVGSKVDPRVKVLFLAWVFLMVSIVGDPLIQTLILAFTVLLVFVNRLSLWDLLKAARLGLFAGAASWILWIIFLRHQGPTLFGLGAWDVTIPGVLNGWSVAARIGAILLAFLIVFKTTATREIMTALYRMHVSVPFAMVIGITLRLIPQLQAEHAIILEAQRSRAVEFETGGLVARMRKHTAYIIPLVLRALKITSDLSLAMEARAFDPYAPRTFSQSLEFESKDLVLMILMALTIVLAVGARTLGFGGMPAQWIPHVGG